MNFKTEEILIIGLAVIIFIAIFIVTEPAILGYAIYEFSNFTDNENILINETIQLKQYTEDSAQQTHYYILTFAQENDKDKMAEISEKDNSFVELDIIDIFKIRFNNTLENQDKLNLYLANTKQASLQICNFNTTDSCENQTIYSTINYPGIEGYYQTTLDLPEPTDEFAMYSPDEKIKIDYINASHTETAQSTYYIPSEIETEIIQPESLDKWDIFTSDYTLNNQTITFYYKTSDTYQEFTPPYNFSETNSTNLQFKLFLYSDNSSTSVIYNLTINYIENILCQENWTCTDWNECTNETQTRTCIDQNECGTQENKPLEIQNCTIEEPIQNSPSSSGSSSPSTRRYTTSTPTVKTETKTVSQKVELKTTPEPEEIIEIEYKRTPNLKIIGNAVAVSYLAFLCLLLYRRRHKL